MLQVAHFSKLIRSLHFYQPELPDEILSRAVSLQGSMHRLESAFNKMITGQPVQIVLLGGSLSKRGWIKEDESYINQVHKWLELSFVDKCKNEAVDNQMQDLHSTSSLGYLMTGHMCNHSHIKLLNLAVPAAGPAYSERCVLHQLPEEVDIAILDFGVNDHFEPR